MRVNKLIIIFVLFLAACENPSTPKDPSIPDQCLRRELFNECMKQIPNGPVVTHYNDWDEVVSECRAYAWGVSTRLQSTIKKECQ